MTDWKVGDLAVCVNAEGAENLTEGAVYTVREAWPESCLDALGRRSHVTMLLEEALPNSGTTGFNAERFRKVQHDKPEACETAFTVLLNRSKRKVRA